MDMVDIVPSAHFSRSYVENLCFAIKMLRIWNKSYIFVIQQNTHTSHTDQVSYCASLYGSGHKGGSVLLPGFAINW